MDTVDSEIKAAIARAPLEAVPLVKAICERRGLPVEDWEARAIISTHLGGDVIK